MAGLLDTVMFLPYLIVVSVTMFSAGLATAVDEPTEPLAFGAALCPVRRHRALLCDERPRRAALRNPMARRAFLGRLRPRSADRHSVRFADHLRARRTLPDRGHCRRGRSRVGRCQATPNSQPGVGSSYGKRSSHSHRGGAERLARRAALEPQSGALGRIRNHEARPGELHHRRGRGVRGGERRSSAVAATVSRGHRRRTVLFEEPAPRCTGVRAFGAGDLSKCAVASAARHRRTGRGRLGRADEHRGVSSVAVACRELRQPPISCASTSTRNPEPTSATRFRRRRSCERC